MLGKHFNFIGKIDSFHKFIPPNLVDEPTADIKQPKDVVSFWWRMFEFGQCHTLPAMHSFEIENLKSFINVDLVSIALPPGASSLCCCE